MLHYSQRLIRDDGVMLTPNASDRVSAHSLSFLSFSVSFSTSDYQTVCACSQLLLLVPGGTVTISFTVKITFLLGTKRKM